MHAFSAETLRGKKIHMDRYKGKVLLITNIASDCAFTPQLKDLQKLQERFKTKNFEVLAFPSNSFRQEPLKGREIQKFCRLNYGVKFTIFKKNKVKGADKSPLFKFLVDSSQSKLEIAWNFEKFLIDQNGKVVKRYPSSLNPMNKDLSHNIHALLEK